MGEPGNGVSVSAARAAKTQLRGWRPGAGEHVADDCLNGGKGDW